MQPSAERTRHWFDRLGIWTSAMCVVHCLLTPVLLSFSAVLAHTLPGEERTHRSFAVLVALFGALALLRGFRKHRRKQIRVMMLAGLGLIAGAAWCGDQLPSHACEVAVTFAGSLLMITAHRMNHTFCNDCECTRNGAARMPRDRVFAF